MRLNQASQSAPTSAPYTSHNARLLIVAPENNHKQRQNRCDRNRHEHRSRWKKKSSSPSSESKLPHRKNEWMNEWMNVCSSSSNSWRKLWPQRHQGIRGVHEECAPCEKQQQSLSSVWNWKVGLGWVLRGVLGRNPRHVPDTGGATETVNDFLTMACCRVVQTTRSLLVDVGVHLTLCFAFRKVKN